MGFKESTETAETGKVIRLMELFNITIEGKTGSEVTATFASESYDEVRKIKVQLIQWIPKGDEYPCEVVMPDASITAGYAEAACKKLTPETIIQFERFGFTRVNESNQKISLITHINNWRKIHEETR